MNKYICVRELIFRRFRDVSLGRLCSNSLISSAATTSRNLTPAPRGCKIACKRVFIFRPRLGGLPHLPGIPHLHVNGSYSRDSFRQRGPKRKLTTKFFHYLRHNELPIDFSKDQSRDLRKKAQKFVLEDGGCFLLVRKMVSLKDGFTAETSSSKYWKLVTLTNLLVTSAVTRREKRFVLSSEMLLLNFKIVVTI